MIEADWKKVNRSSRRGRLHVDPAEHPAYHPPGGGSAFRKPSQGRRNMLRTTLIRGTLLALFGLAGATLWWAQSYVRPEAVRSALLDSFADQFPGSDVRAESAQLRILGGVSVRNLSLARDGDSRPFFDAPAAVIVHDKEALSAGRMVIRKIELDGPTLRLERRADGRWTFDGLSKPAPSDKPVPMFVVQRGTITIADKSASGLPPLTFTEANFTLVNDPPPLFLNVKGTALLRVTDLPMTPMRVELNGRLHRLTGEFTFHIVAADVALGPDLAGLVRPWKPSLVDSLAAFTASANVKADLSYKPDAPQPLTYELDVRVKNGRFRDPRLPVPVENLEAAVKYRDGRITIEKATAKLGTCTAEVSLESRTLAPGAVMPIPGAPLSQAPGVLASTARNPPKPDVLTDLEDQLDRLDLTLRNLTLTDELFEGLGDRMVQIRQRFQPAGVVAVGYHFQRSTTGGWRRDYELRPTRFAMTYERFRYPLTDLAGLVRKTVTSTGHDETGIDLTGTAGGQRIGVKGTVHDSGSPDPGIDLRITGANVPLDDRIYEALPRPRHQSSLKKLHATGRMDVVAEVKQTAGVNLTESTFRFKVYDAKFCHEQFPYPLDNVSGQIAVQLASYDPARPLRPGQPLVTPPDTDRITLSDFTGRHGKGSVAFRGTHTVIPGESDHRLSLNVTGQNCPLDDDLKKALASLKLDAVWTTFSPRGAMTFAVDVDIADRSGRTPARLPPPYQPRLPMGLLTARTKSPPPELPNPPFNPSTDLSMTMQFTGPTITPDFFPYQLDSLAGRVRYDGTQVRVEKFTAKHGASQWALDAGEVRFFPDGRVWANMGRLDVSPVAIDEAFLTALPKTLEKAARGINLRGPAELSLKHLVVLTPSDRSPLPRFGGEGRVRGLDQSEEASGLIGYEAPFTLPSPPAKPEGDGTEPDPDIYWTGELRLNGAALDAGVTWDRLKGRIASTGRYYGTHLGEVVGNIWLDEGTAADHPVRQVKLHYRADPQTPDPAKPGQWEPVAVRLADLTGKFFDGDVACEARVVLCDPVRYRVRLDATEIKLEDLARFHGLKDSRVEGTAQASIRLETVTDAAGVRLDGAGTFDVDKGRMLNLPFLMPLLKTLKLQAPDKTAFEEAHAQFTIRGDRLKVTHLDLLGDAVSIGGSGETDFQGQHVKFDCYTIWSQTLHRWLTTPFGDLSAFINEKLFRIEISRGTDGQMKYDARLMPIVTDPMRALMDRVKKRKNGHAEDDHGGTEKHRVVTENSP